MTTITIPLDETATVVFCVIVLSFAFYGVYSFAKNMRPKTLIPDIKRWIAARTQSDDQYD